MVIICIMIMIDMNKLRCMSWFFSFFELEYRVKFILSLLSNIYIYQ